MSKRRTPTWQRLKAAKERVRNYETQLQAQALRLQYLESSLDLFRDNWQFQVEQNQTKDETIGRLIALVGNLKDKLKEQGNNY